MTDPSGPIRPQLRLLLAEDNAVNQAVTIRMLEKLGYAVDVVTNGVEAVDAVGAAAYDAVLMDLNMPEMDGIEAARRIRQRWNGTGPAIVAVTANDSAETRGLCASVGMNGFLGKPISRDSLDQVIRSVIHERHAEPVTEPSSAATGVSDGLKQQLEEFSAMFGPEMVEELLSLFTADTPARIRRLRIAIADGDAEETRRVAHAIKGSSATMGMDSLAQECATLELKGRNADLDGAAELLGRIETLYGAIETYAKSLGIWPADPA